MSFLGVVWSRQLYQKNFNFNIQRYIVSSYNLCFNQYYHQAQEKAKKYIPRRSLLYVPGSDTRKLVKIPNLHSDCIVLDCEDGVALNKKEEARKTIHQFLQKPEMFAGKDCSVRLNAVDSEFFADDVEATFAGPVLPSTVLLPKVESWDQVALFTDKLKKVLKQKILDGLDLRLLIYVESAQSLLSLDSICREVLRITGDSAVKLDGIVFGSDDFCADIGATRTSEAEELLFARQWTVTVAKCHRLQAVDMVYIDYKDLDGLKRQCEEGARFGFTGKQVIHPSQAAVAVRAFSPSPEAVGWARDLVRAFELHQQEGKGAFTFRGSMIDKPLLLQARNILNMSDSAETKS